MNIADEALIAKVLDFLKSKRCKRRLLTIKKAVGAPSCAVVLNAMDVLYKRGLIDDNGIAR